MEFLTELWLPILLSAVFVFIASSIIHMALPYHRSDVKKMPSEEAVLTAMRSGSIAPGAYMFPCADSYNEMCTPEMKAKMEKGPVGWLTVLPAGGFNMGKSLVGWFIYCLIIGVMVAYVSWHGLQAGADYLKVFQLTGSAAVLGYVVGYLHESIWKGQSWPVTAKFMFDGVIYALLTAGTFGWLWPDAATLLPG